MVCNRCIYVLQKELAVLGFEVLDIRLGQVELKGTDSMNFNENAFRAMLQRNGFDMLYSKNQVIVEKIKELVEKGIQMQVDTKAPIRFSTLISSELNKNYDTLSSLFSAESGDTLEKYIILRKIEKVKELLVYTELSLTEVAFLLGYSSPAHLSNQLKKHTGFTSSYFKQVRTDKQRVIEAHLKRTGNH